MMSRRMFSVLLLAAHAMACTGVTYAQALPLSGDAPTVKVGDTWRWVRSDKRTGIKEIETLRVIKSVSADRIEASENDGVAIFMGDMNAIETPDWARVPPTRFVEFPLAVGKKWSLKFVQNGKTGNRLSARYQYDAEVVGQEKVKVAAGEFDVFKIVYKGFWNNDTTRRSGRATITSWYAPAARGAARVEYEDGYNDNVTELVELRLEP